MSHIFRGLLALGVILVGCHLTLDDDDMCAGNLVYFPEYNSCLCTGGRTYSAVRNECYCADDGTRFSKELDACVPEEADDTAQDVDDTAGTDIEDAGADDGGTGTNAGDTDEDKEFGLGTSCLDSAECAAFIAEHCMVNPLDNTGYCTTLDCASGDCETGYRCCDCTGASLLSQVVVCLTDADAELAISFSECSCE